MITEQWTVHIYKYITDIIVSTGFCLEQFSSNGLSEVEYRSAGKTFKQTCYVLRGCAGPS